MKGKQFTLLSLLSLAGLGICLSYGQGKALTSSNPFFANTGKSSEKYTSEYDSWQDVIDAEKDLNAEIGKEGIVLLKNDSDILPLGRIHKNISLFGKNSVNPVYSGSGSSGGT